MRTIFRNAVLAAGAILFCAVGTAQASESIVLKANVPFPFVVKGQVFPAGKYAVVRDDTTPSLLLIRSETSSRPVAFVETTRTPATTLPDPMPRSRSSGTRMNTASRLSGNRRAWGGI